jgi:DNA-binding CsgD family transcriptional regulator
MPYQEQGKGVVWHRKVERERMRRVLTPMQKSVLAWIESQMTAGRDTSQRAIANEFNISTRTVKSHFNSIRRILNLEGGHHTLEEVILASKRTSRTRKKQRR